MKKKLFWMKWCLFYFYLIYLLRADIPSFFTAKIASQTSKRHLSACNIWRFPRLFFKKFKTSCTKQILCFICFNNLVKYFSGARLRRCLISSKTVEISLAKFHEIQKTNNAHDVKYVSILLETSFNIKSMISSIK
jgi:hypothetical protein